MFFYELINLKSGVKSTVQSDLFLSSSWVYKHKSTGVPFAIREDNKVQILNAPIFKETDYTLDHSSPLRIITIKFNTSNKTYDYYIYKKDAEKLVGKDRVLINSVYGKNEPLIIGISNDCSINHSATKLLPLIDEAEEKLTKYRDIVVKFFNKTGYSSEYKYSVCVDNNLWISGFIWLNENQCPVRVVDVSLPYSTNKPHHRLKTFGGVDVYDMKELFHKLGGPEEINEEIKQDLINLGKWPYHETLEETTATKLNQLSTAMKQVGEAANNTSNVITQLTYGGNLVDIPSKCNCATENDNIKYEYKNNDYILKEEKSMMNKMFKGMVFGKINTGEIKYSFQGMSFRGYDGRYTAYCIDKENGSISAIDVGDMVMDIPVMAMPVSTKDVKIGDVIMHQSNFVIVKCFYDDGTIGAINPITSTEVSIIPVKNIFGFNCVSKVLNFFDNLNPSAEAPFGDMSKMLPFMMMGEGGMKNKDMFLMMALAGGNMDFTSNPMLMMAMMQD